jgi:hypothetical protein
MAKRHIQKGALAYYWFVVGECVLFLFSYFSFWLFKRVLVNLSMFYAKYVYCCSYFFVVCSCKCSLKEIDKSIIQIYVFETIFSKNSVLRLDLRIG